MAFLSRQEFLKNCAVYDDTKLQDAGLPKVELNGSNLLLQIKGIVEKVWGTSLLPQVVRISSIKPISSSISLNIFHSFIAKNFSISTGVVNKIIAMQNTTQIRNDNDCYVTK